VEGEGVTLLARIIGNERHGIQKYFLGWNSSICAEQKIWRTCRKEEKSFGRRGVGTSARYFFFFLFPFSSSIGVFRLVRLERCVVVLEMYWYRYRKASSFLFLLLSATVVSVFLSCSPYSPYRPLRRTVDLDVLVRSRTGTVVFVVPAAHGTGLVLTLLLLVLTLAGNQST
jgi:hypothetical protein